MIKNLPARGQEILIEEFNKILNGGNLPNFLKKYNVLCIPKQNRNNDRIDNFRPIVLAPTILKILELLIKNRLDWIMENEKMLSSFQIGFRRNQGIHNAQGILITNIQKAFSKGELLLAIFLDIKSAYDSINIYTLYNKLMKIKLPIDIINIIFKILNNRILFSKNKEGQLIGPIISNSGLPQGSPLSALLFNLYIKDIYNILIRDCQLITYADDMVIFISGKNKEEMSKTMNNMLTKIERWLEINNFKLAYEKCETVWFTKSRKKKG